MPKSPANFMLGGEYVYGSAYDQSSLGYYWSSTADDSSSACFLYMGSSSANASDGGYKDSGFSVRCVARVPGE